jgi:hypothetical protein
MVASEVTPDGRDMHGVIGAVTVEGGEVGRAEMI